MDLFSGIVLVCVDCVGLGFPPLVRGTIGCFLFLFLFLFYFLFLVVLMVGEGGVLQIFSGGGWLVQWYRFMVSGGVVDGFVVLGLWLVVFIDYGCGFTTLGLDRKSVV